jgi:hypothetical protein
MATSLLSNFSRESSKDKTGSPAAGDSATHLAITLAWYVLVTWTWFSQQLSETGHPQK